MQEIRKAALKTALYFRLRWFVIHGDVTDESKETIMHEATAAPPSKR